MNSNTAIQRNHDLSLPQLNFGGISENWLMKEIGDVHWAMICKGMRTQSHQIVDENNNRLYASFVRVRYESSHPLSSYKESETFHLSGQLTHYGSRLFFGEIGMECGGKYNKASLMTVFISRDKDNKRLETRKPVNVDQKSITGLATIPAFGQEYLKASTRHFDVSESLQNTKYILGGEEIKKDRGQLFQIVYRINPYYEMNNANLLYFASYPLIHSASEREYFNGIGRELGIGDDWALSVSPLARDVFYYGNCNIDEQIHFVMNSCDFVDGFKVKMFSSLYRSSDNLCIADIFSVYQLVDL